LSLCCGKYEYQLGR